MFSGCSNDSDNQSSIPLTQAEIDDLKFLREEEKLARDVYLFSYDKYEAAIFNNISQSEQKHMNSVLSLMNKYGIPDSASTEIGVFNNSDLQSLYWSLTAQSDISLIEALKVGATIEDLDIKLYLNTLNSNKNEMTEKCVRVYYEIAYAPYKQNGLDETKTLMFTLLDNRKYEKEKEDIEDKIKLLLDDTISTLM